MVGAPGANSRGARSALQSTASEIRPLLKALWIAQCILCEADAMLKSWFILTKEIPNWPSYVPEYRIYIRITADILRKIQ